MVHLKYTETAGPEAYAPEIYQKHLGLGTSTKTYKDKDVPKENAFPNYTRK